MQPDPADPRLVTALAALARDTAGEEDAGPPVVLSHRMGELVVRCGTVVAKLHKAGADLDPRLRLAAEPGLRDVLVAPLARAHIGGRAATVWPAGAALHPAQLDDTPWERAADLLARLHAYPAPAELGPNGGPGRVSLALRRLAGHRAWGGPRARAVLAAYETLPAWARGAAPAPPSPGGGLVHGDFHLGQLIQLPLGGWRLIDVDDLGTGDPAWDLGRPAAWYAAGLLPPETWQRFLGAYRAAGGCAVPPAGDPWPALDVPARALTVQTAALAIVNCDLEIAPAFVASCRRITRLDATYRMRVLSKLLRV